MSTIIPTTKQPPAHECFFEFIYASETWCISLFVVVVFLIVVVLPLLIYSVFRCRNGNEGNEAGILMQKHLNDSNKYQASERYEAKEETTDDKSSEENTREGEGNENQSRSTQDKKESNSFTNERIVNNPKQSNEITHDESALKTDM